MTEEKDYALDSLSEEDKENLRLVQDHLKGFEGKGESDLIPMNDKKVNRDYAWDLLSERDKENLRRLERQRELDLERERETILSTATLRPLPTELQKGLEAVIIPLKEKAIAIDVRPNMASEEFKVTVYGMVSKIIPESKPVRKSKVVEFSYGEKPVRRIDYLLQILNKLFPCLNAPLFLAETEPYTLEKEVEIECDETVKIIYVNGQYAQHAEEAVRDIKSQCSRFKDWSSNFPL